MLKVTQSIAVGHRGILGTVLVSLHPAIDRRQGCQRGRSCLWPFCLAGMPEAGRDARSWLGQCDAGAQQAIGPNPHAWVHSCASVLINCS